jgi:preprotein translocase subunit SecB
MAKKKTNKKVQENLVDVSTEETQYVVQCEDVRLITSNLSPLIIEDDSKKDSNFAFMVRAVVEENTAYSYLEVLANHFIDEGPVEVEGFQLRFVLMGTFLAKEDTMSPEDLGEFVKMYTLSILWPYAREYATDQIRRASGDIMTLPIINPQVVTEHIVENNLVEVQIISSKEKVKM